MGSDYRLSAIVVYSNMKGKCFKETEMFLQTLMEMTKLAYTKAKHRNQHSLISHLPQIARIISDEERMFSKINNISLGTSTRTSELK